VFLVSVVLMRGDHGKKRGHSRESLGVGPAGKVGDVQESDINVGIRPGQKTRQT